MTRKKSRGPALYEVIGKRSAGNGGQSMPAPPARRKGHRAVHKQVRPVQSKPSVTTQGSSSNGGSSWLMAGSALRVPSGIVVAVAVLVLVVVLMSYMIGHRRGRDVAVAQMTGAASDSGQMIAAGGQLSVVDPLATTTNSILVPPLPGAAGDESLGDNGNSEAAWGPIESDLRVSGLNYFVLAEWHGEEMVALAEFCRTRGLETYVVPGKNDRFHRVIAVPGFESTQRNDPWVLELESDIHKAGRAWKRAGGGRDLSDAYPSLYRSAS